VTASYASLPKDPARARQRLKAAIQSRYSPRLHMSLMLAASGLSAMLTSAILLGVGVHSMVARYPIAILMAYGVFLVGVWTWLRATGFVDNHGHRTGKASDLVPNLDIPGGRGGSWGGGGGGSSPSILRGGGGTFDGGGASASFAEVRAPAIATGLDTRSAGSDVAGKAAGSLLDGIDGDGLALLLLAVALVASIFVTSGYLVWCAPDLLAEAAFGALLTGSLARPAKKQTPMAWVGGVVRRTWWPFAIVLVVATLFAGYAAKHYPQASTFRQAIALATH